MSGQQQVVRPEVGQPAPQFKLQDTEGNWFESKAVSGEGKSLVLVFFRGEWCPISKRELVGLTSDHAKFKELNSQIVAVSCISVDKSKALKTKLNLPFTLLSDPGFEAIDRYGVRVVRSEIKDDERHSSNPGISATYIRYIRRVETYAGPSVFIIDNEGHISYKFFGRNEPTDFPANEVLLAKLKNES